MFMRAAHRSKLTTSLFSTTFIIAVLTVAAPQIIGCPVKPNQLGADATRQQQIVRKEQDKQNSKNDEVTGWQGKSVVVVDRSRE